MNTFDLITRFNPLYLKMQNIILTLPVAKQQLHNFCNTANWLSDSHGTSPSSTTSNFSASTPGRYSRYNSHENKQSSSPQISKSSETKQLQNSPHTEPPTNVVYFRDLVKRKIDPPQLLRELQDRVDEVVEIANIFQFIVVEPYRPGQELFMCGSALGYPAEPRRSGLLRPCRCRKMVRQGRTWPV